MNMQHLNLFGAVNALISAHPAAVPDPHGTAGVEQDEAHIVYSHLSHAGKDENEVFIFCTALPKAFSLIITFYDSHLCATLTFCTNEDGFDNHPAPGEEGYDGDERDLKLRSAHPLGYYCDEEVVFRYIHALSDYYEGWTWSEDIFDLFKQHMEQPYRKNELSYMRWATS